LTRSEEHTMQATVSRNECVVGEWTDELSRETGQAVVRDLLQFEGFRSHDGIRRPGSWSPGWRTTDPPITSDTVIAHAQVVPAPGPQTVSAASFPRRRRHDLGALTAYGAYRRSRTLEARPSRQATGTTE
jgi:hypothetical protein